MVKSPPATAGDGRDLGSIPGLGRSPGEGHGSPPQYPHLRIPWTEEHHGLQSVGSQSGTQLRRLSTQHPQVALVTKNAPARAGDSRGRSSLDWVDPLRKEMATHSSILAWEIPRTEEPGGLQSTGSQRVRLDLATKQQTGPVGQAPGEETGSRT